MNLRTPIPTLEPDDAFVARLSALAAASAPTPEVVHRPVPTWRVALAAASVAAVLVGVAWVAGLDPTGSPNPAPQPAISPSAPENSAQAAPEPGVRTTPEPPGAFAAAPPATPVTTTSHPAGTDPGRGQGASALGTGGNQDGAAGNGNAGENANENAAGNASGNENASGNGPQNETAQDRGRGPNAKAGDHPNEHATTKSNQGHQQETGKPGRGKGGRSGR